MTEIPSSPERDDAAQSSGSSEVADNVIIAEPIGSIFDSKPAEANPTPPSPAIDAISYFVNDTEEDRHVEREATVQSEFSGHTLAVEVDDRSQLASVLKWLGDDKLAAAIAERALVAMLYPLAFAGEATPDREPVLGELEVAGAASLAYLIKAIDTVEEAIGLSVTDKLRATIDEYCESVKNGEHRFDSERIGYLYKDTYIKDRRRKARLVLDNLEVSGERAGEENKTKDLIKSINESCVFKNSIGY